MNIRPYIPDPVVHLLFHKVTYIFIYIKKKAKILTSLTPKRNHHFLHRFLHFFS